MQLESFLKEVLSRVKAHLPEDEDQLKMSVEHLHSLKFTVEDAVAYCRCMEEVNPAMAEETALRRMNTLMQKYSRKEATPCG